MTQPLPQTGASPEDLDPATWVDSHGDALFAYAMSRVRDRSIAEDLVQESFLIALDRLSTFEGRSTLRTWLIGILRNKILQYLQRDNGRRPTGLLSSSLLDETFGRAGKWRNDPKSWGQDPQKAAADADLLQVLRNCIAALPVRSAEALRAGEQGGLNGEQLGQLLGVAPNTVYVILYRARTALRQCLEKNGYDRAVEQ